MLVPLQHARRGGPSDLQLPPPRMGARDRGVWGARPAGSRPSSTFACNGLAAGVSVFELARVMGTSVAMIERHYGTLLEGAGADIARRPDAFDRTARAWHAEEAHERAFDAYGDASSRLSGPSAPPRTPYRRWRACGRCSRPPSRTRGWRTWRRLGRAAMWRSRLGQERARADARGRAQTPL